MRFLLVALVFVGCVRGVHSPGGDLPPEVVRYWGTAQMRLIENGYSKYQVTSSIPEHFSFLKYQGTFPCGEQMDANGCFDYASREISYNAHQAHVLIHEACHAIGWRNRWPEWQELGHGEYSWCN